MRLQGTRTFYRLINGRRSWISVSTLWRLNGTLMKDWTEKLFRDSRQTFRRWLFLMPNDSGVPTSKSIQFFRKAIGKHSAVASVTDRGENVFVIDRNVHPPVVVFLTDVYTVGLADLLDAMDKIPDLNCIVTASNWNGYTRAAKEHGLQLQVGIFLIGEFLGALNRNDHWEYVKHNENGQPVYHYRG
jgi:hypothetical protein